MFNSSLLLNSDIMPEVSGAWASFFSGIGSFFVWLGSAIIKGIASIAYLVCKLVMGLIDFMQFLVQKLAGIEVYMNMEKFDPESLKQSDIVFRFLFSDAVTKVLKSIMVVFIVLLIVFTIFAIIKNEYKAATTGDDKLDHRKSLYTAFKAIITVVLVPIMLVMGIMGSNAILASIARAYNISGNLTLGGQIFVASAYDASLYRNYANNGVRKYTSNQVSFEYNGETYTVNSALEVITPNSYSNTNPFTGYMFTYDGSTYYLCKCDATNEEVSGSSKIYYNKAYYYYLKYVLGAYIVEQEPEHDTDIQEYFSKKGYNTTNIATDSDSIINNVKEVYNYFCGQWVWDKLLSWTGNALSFGVIQKDQSYLSSKGFMIHELYDENGGSLLIDAAYNTWSYNSIVATDLSNWGSQNVSLETNTDTFTTLAGRSRVATVVQNSASWGKLHDGGVYGFHPLSVEYLAMADVMDFVLENGIALYYVNANNANINYEKGGVALEYRYKNGENPACSAGFDGFLVDYKDVGRVAYEVKDNVVSELDGATYIVCYYSDDLNQYVPVVNGEKVYDSYGNSYKFSSSQYSDDYKGVVIARGMFNDSSQARATEPTYLTSAMVIGNKKTDFDSKVATALKLDLLSGGIGYNYLGQLTDVSSANFEKNLYDTITPNTWTKNGETWNYGDDTYYWNGTNLIYCLNQKYTNNTSSDEGTATASGSTIAEGEETTISPSTNFGTSVNRDIYSHMADILVNKICISDDGVGVKSFEMEDGSFDSEINKCTFKIKRIGADNNDQRFIVTMDITCEIKEAKNGTNYYRYVVTPTIEDFGAKVVWNNYHKGFAYTENLAGILYTRSNTLYMYEEGTMLYFSDENNIFSMTNYEQLSQIVKATLSLWDDGISLAPVNYSADTLNNEATYISKLEEDIESKLKDGKYSIVVSSRDKDSNGFSAYAGQKKYTLTFNFNKENNNSISSNAKYPSKLTYVTSGIEVVRKAIFGLEITSASDDSYKIGWENYTNKNKDGTYTNENEKYTIAYNVSGDTLVSKDDSYGAAVYVYSNDTNYSKIYDSSNIFTQLGKEQAAKVLNMMLESFNNAPSGYKYKFASFDEQLSIKELKSKLTAADLPELENGLLQPIFLALVKDSSADEGTGTLSAETSENTSDVPVVKNIYSLKFDLSAGAGNKYQAIINTKDNEYHYWKVDGVQTDLECKDVFILSVTPVEDNPRFSRVAVLPTFAKDNFYHQIDYKTLEDEFFYCNTQGSMTDSNLPETVENLAKAFVREVLQISDWTCEYVKSSATYSGNVEYAPNSTGSLTINFMVKVTKPNKNNNDVYYYINFTLDMSSHDSVPQDSSNDMSSHDSVTQDRYYLYKFDLDYNIYNTYNLYIGGKVVKDSNGEDSEELVVTMQDLSYNETDEYVIYEYADSSKNKTITVYQYIYKEYTKDNTYYHIFNAIASKDSKVDEGKKFITGKVEDNSTTQATSTSENEATFTPDFGIDENGTVVTQDLTSKQLDNTRKLVFTTAKMRIIYMPDFTSIIDVSIFKKDDNAGTTQKDKYTFMIVDTQNLGQDIAYLYTMQFDKNAQTINWDDTNNITAWKTSGSGVDKIEGDDTKEIAKEYIQSRFKMEVVDVDLHNYLDITTKKVEDVNYYRTTIITNTARTIYYSSKNALDNLSGSGDSAFDSSVMQQRLIEKANNFNNNSNVITLDYKEYKKAYDFANTVDDILKIISNPITVCCCRDDVTTRQLVADFHINLWSDTGGFTFIFRMPRFGFATKQKNTDDNILLALTKGQFSMDYNFEGKVALGNLYSVVDINYLILVFAVALIFGILGKAVWGLVGRVYQITLLYLMMPVVASTLPIDPDGKRFNSWKEQMITEVLSTYGVTIGLNFFFILIPVIRESTQIFTEADFVTMSSTMKWFAGSPERLNYICYILFLLVAFTLLKTVPKMVQEFTGYKKDVISAGGDLKKTTLDTVHEASTKASNFITGKTAIDGAKKAWGKAKELGTGMIPGKAIYDEYKKKKEGKDGDKKAAEQEAAEAKKKQNQQLAMEHAHETADAAKAKLEEAKAGWAPDGSAAGNAGAQNPANANNAGSNSAYADVAGALDENAKQAIVAEAVQQTGQMAEAAMGMAEAAMEAADAQFGKTHDYVADKEKEEAELKAAEKAQRDYENSRIGKAEAAYNESLESGKGYDLLFKKDIEEWNKNHPNEQISTEKITRQKNESDADFEARKQKDLENRLKASHQKHLDRLYARKEDEKVGIKHGVGHSIVRTVVGGRKTMWQRGKEARELQLLEEEKNTLIGQKLTAYRNDKRINEYLDNNFGVKGLGANGEADKMYDDIKKYAKKYGFEEKAEESYFEAMKGLNPNKLADRQRALEAMKQSIRDQSKDKKENIDEQLKQKNKELDNMEDKFAQDRKGWIYKGGNAINTKVIQPGLSKAKVPAKWLADKGHTFIAGHTEQDKESAKQFLKLDQIASLTKKINTADNSLNRMKKRRQDQTDLLKIMTDFDKAKNKQDKQQLLDDNKALLKKMGYNGKTLKEFENYKSISRSAIVKDRAELSTKITNKYREKKNYESKLNQINNALSDPKLQKSVKKAQQMLNGTHVRSVGVPVAAAKGAAKLGKWAGQGVWTAAKWAGNKVVGVGKAVGNTVSGWASAIANNPKVVKAVHDTKVKAKWAGRQFTRFAKEQQLQAKILVSKIKASPEYKAATKVVKDAAKLGKWAGKGVWTAAKTVAGVPVGIAKGVYNTGKKVVAWHNRVSGAFDGAAAYARANKDSSRVATEAKYKSVQDLIGKTLKKKEKEQMNDIEKRLQDRINRLKGKDESKLLTKANALKVAEMERLLKGFKTGTLTDAERKQIDKYLNFSAAKTKAKLEETQKRMSRNQATVLSRANQERLIKELNKNTKAQYTSMLQKELKNMGFTPAQINSMVSKYAKSSAKDYYAGMKQDINQLLRQKQAAMQQALKNGQQNAKLLTEIRQLNALVGKMRLTDARYRKDLIRLNESNRKLGKQLKNKKSADALSSSIKSQMTNPYTNNGNNGNGGRP